MLLIKLAVRILSGFIVVDMVHYVIGAWMLSAHSQ